MAEATEVKWWASKTLWVNVIALVAFIAQGVTGKLIISAEIQAGALAAINFILRLITKAPVVW